MMVVIVISLKGREGDILRLVTLVRLRRLSLDSLRSAEKIRRRRVGGGHEPRAPPHFQTSFGVVL